MHWWAMIGFTFCLEASSGLMSVSCSFLLGVGRGALLRLSLLTALTLEFESGENVLKCRHL